MKKIVFLSLAFAGLAGTASAQLKAHLDIGFASKNDQFDKDGEREDFEDFGGTDEFLVPIVLGATYDVFHGLYLGADLSLLNRSVIDIDREKTSSFGVRELDLVAGYSGGLGMVDLDVQLGFKVDIGKLPDTPKGSADDADLVGNTGRTTSDNQHAVHLGLQALFKPLYGLSIGPRVAAVFHLAREVDPDDKLKAANSIQSGILVDAGLVVAGRINLGQIALLVGFDIGYLHQGETTVEDDNGKLTETPESDFYLLSLAPYFGVNFQQHTLKVSLSLPEEDAITGIPLIGKNVKITTVPATITYQFSM